MAILLLPPRFSGAFALSAALHGDYLQAVGGGHPVHSSRDLAVRSGFADVPLAGIHLLGAAMAAFTRQFARNPIQLLKVDTKFVRPAYPGDEFELELALLDSKPVAGTPFIAGRYQGHCTNVHRQKVLMLDFKVRVAVAGNGGG
ncbi:MAG: MaoC family dehydratase [Achromobacter sp.]|uniref:MaoC family dehydratase n=1 Tax=Achromobacter sp. TaxID=134375 RepID=UPI00258493CA|nr:MaoC family dehydratase [Achromobacter sp.]MCW0209362.1 MaoC family dehydratase [Achromobacter sp.]